MEARRSGSFDDPSRAGAPRHKNCADRRFIMSSSASDPEYWQCRAAEARVAAARMTDALSRRAMISVAARYERLADRAAAKRDIFGQPELAVERPRSGEQ